MPSTILLLLAAAASGAGGGLLGPAGEPPPTSSASRISVAPAGEATTWVVSVRVGRPASELAWLWPAAGLQPTSVEVLRPEWFDRIDTFTAPRVQEITCDELVETLHWATPPGCASYEVERPEVRVGEDAVEALAAEGGRPVPDLETVVLDADGLATWLELRGLTLDPEMAAALQPHLDAGEDVLAVRVPQALTSGEWTPPVRFVAAGPPLLPLTVGASVAEGPHELLLYGVTAAGAGNPSLLNYPRGYVEDDCLLPRRTTAAEWLDAGLQAFPPGLPTWVLEHASPADACDPCTAPPLERYELGDLGADLEPDAARVSRIRMRIGPGALDQDPELAFGGDESAAMLRFIERREELEFAFPTCGQDRPPGDPGTCPDLPLPGSGCATGPAPALPALGLALVLLTRRRRRTAVLAAALLCAAPARAGLPPPGSPRTELKAGLAVVGTDRVVPTGLAHGAPWLGNPYVAVEARRSWFGVGDRVDLGVFAALRGMVGDAAPWGTENPYGFLLAEPQLGLDVRHGTFREASPCLFARWGGALTVPVLDPGPTPARAVPGFALHAGAGLWAGRGTTRPSLELRGSVLPRTDGFETSFHENVGLPGFLFFPGTANLWLIAGVAFY